LEEVDESSGFINFIFLELTKQFSLLENCSTAVLSSLRWQIKGDLFSMEIMSCLLECSQSWHPCVPTSVEVLDLSKHSPELHLPWQHGQCEGGLAGGSSLPAAWVMPWQ